MIDLSDERLNRTCAKLQGLTYVSDGAFLRRGVVLDSFYYTAKTVTGGRPCIYLVFRFNGQKTDFDKSLNTINTEISVTYKNFAHCSFTIEQPFNFEDGKVLVALGSDLADLDEMSDIVVEPVLVRQ